MPVNSTHPDYDAAFPDWLRAREVLSGEDAVKSAGEKYLPRLDSQTDEEFLAYRKRAAFFNATARRCLMWMAQLIIQVFLMPGPDTFRTRACPTIHRAPLDARELEGSSLS